MPLPLRSLCSALPPPSARTAASAPPLSRGQRGRRAHALPRPPRAAPGKSGISGREGRRNGGITCSVWLEHRACPRAQPPTLRSRPGGVGCAGPGGGYWHGASSAPCWQCVSQDQLGWKRPQTPSSPAYDRTITLSITPCHQLPCPVFLYIPPARVTPPPP